MTKHPTVKALSFTTAMNDYGATYLRDALARFIVKYRDPTLNPSAIERASAGVYFHFHTIPVFHKIELELNNAEDILTSQTQDVIHARPPRHDRQQCFVPGRFDTALIKEPEPEGQTLGLQGYRVGQVRLIFRLPSKQSQDLFPSHMMPPGHLAYVEWFTAFPAADANHGLRKILRCVRNGARLASVIEVKEIERSCHLFPDFGPVAPREWSTHNVLEECMSFWVNPFTDRHAYMTMF